MKFQAKRLILLFLCPCFAMVSNAQLKPHTKCPDLTVDVLNGTVNGLKPNTGAAEFKASVPCCTSSDFDASGAKCGGGIYYKDKDVSFYTQRKYFQIGPKFKGKISMQIFGKPRNSLFSVLGNPKMKDDLWDAYETQYGTLVLHYNVPGKAGRVNLIQMSTLGTDELTLCE